MNPIVFTIELSSEFPVLHNITQQIASLINSFKEFDEAPIKQLVEVTPTSKEVLIPFESQHCT